MFFSTHRKAIAALRKQLAHFLHVERDLINPLSAGALQNVIESCDSALANPALQTPEKLKMLSAQSETVLHQTASRYKRSSVSEILDVAAVALMVAMGIRAIYLQPFKIPTGSMQPTLFGIHYIADKAPDGSHILPNWGIANAFLFGVSRTEFKAPFDGSIRTGSVHQGIDYGWLAPIPLLRDIFAEETTSFVFEPQKLTESSFDIQTEKAITVTLPGTPEKNAQYMNQGLSPERGKNDLSALGPWSKGTMLTEGWLSTGDQLFVDRISHHFTGISRGDVTVFNTEGIVHNGRPLAASGFYYIKRLVGMPGDTLRVRNNHLEVKPEGATDFVKIEVLDSRFEKLYSGKAGYHGHLDWEIFEGGKTVTVPKNCYFMMGDNSRSSSDSRYWGFVPRRNIVGRAFFVFWPFSARWGLTDRENAVKTSSAWGLDSEDPGHQGNRPLPAMSLQ